MQRFVRFGLVGLSGVLVDMTILYLLHTTLGLPLTRSKLVAAEIAIVNNFVWNDACTFADVSLRQRGGRRGSSGFLNSTPFVWRAWCLTWWC